MDILGKLHIKGTTSINSIANSSRLIVGGNGGDAYLHFMEVDNGWNLRHKASDNTLRFRPTLGGTDLLTLKDTGHVGIGITNPDSKLHVVGSIKMDDGNQQNNYVLTSNSDGVGSWQPWTGGLDKYITGGTYNEITEQLDLETNSGELISIPVGSLSVDTDDQTLDLTNNILTISKSNSTVDLSAYINQSNLWTENGTKIYRNSKVGIGTENPAAELEIQGDSLVDIGDVNATQNDNNAYNNVSQLKISNDNNSMTFFTNGTNNVRKSFIQVGHDSASWANGVGELSLNPFGGNVGIGTTDPDEKLHITGLFKTTSNGKYITIGNENASYAHFKTDAPRFYFDKEIVINSGNIKAYSSHDLTLQTDATNRLRIDGSGGAITFNNTYTFPTTDGSADQVLKTDGAGQLSWTTISAGDTNTDSQTLSLVGTDLSISGGNTIDVSSLMDDTNLWTELNGNVYRSTGNVGIGKSNPSTKLHVGGALTTSRLGTYGTYDSNQVQGIWSIGNNYSISTANNDFGSQYGIGYSYNQTGGSPFALQHQIVFTRNGAINAAISLDGNAYFSGSVGVNTTSPDTNLHVAGSIKITGGNPGDGKVLTSDANGLASWQTISVGDTNTDSQELDFNSSTNILSITGGNNVDLSSLLDDTNLWTENGADIYRNSNVGIGTSSPDTNLHVAGNTIVDTQAWVKNNLIVGTDTSDVMKVEIWDDTNPTLRVRTKNDISAIGSSVFLQRSRTNNNLQVGDRIGNIYFWGYGSSNSLEGEVILSSSVTSNGADFSIEVNNIGDYAFYVQPTTGNIGLTTDDPTQKLDVNGKIRMRTGAINGYIPVSDANGVMTWTNPSSVLSDTNYYLSSASVEGNILTFNMNGISNHTVNLHWNENGNNDVYRESNVGVNTTNPTSHLHVDGSVATAIAWGGTSNYTVQDDDYTIIAQPGYNVLLPNPNLHKGRMIVVKKNGSGSDVSVCVQSSNDHVIDINYHFINLTGAGSAITLQSEGTQGKWHLIGCCGTHEYKIYVPGVAVSEPVGGRPPQYPSVQD